MDRKIKYSAVIPVYNEASNIKLLHQRLTETLSKLGEPYEIILVDDGSSDSSFEELKKVALQDKTVKVISFVKNFGQHPAVVAGIDSSNGEIVVTLDADLQNPPEEIITLIKAIKEGYDMVGGIRSGRQDTSFRCTSSNITNFLLNMLTRSRIKDYGTMLRAYNAETAKEIADRYREERLYIPVLINKVTKNILEIEVSHDSRHSGESKYRLFKLIKTFMSIFMRYNRKVSRFMQSVYLMKKDGELYQIKEKINIL